MMFRFKPRYADQYPVQDYEFIDQWTWLGTKRIQLLGVRDKLAYVVDRHEVEMIGETLADTHST